MLTLRLVYKFLVNAVIKLACLGHVPRAVVVFIILNNFGRELLVGHN
jgi:hypothetical protein